MVVEDCIDLWFLEIRLFVVVVYNCLGWGGELVFYFVGGFGVLGFLVVVYLGVYFWLEDWDFIVFG